MSLVHQISTELDSEAELDLERGEVGQPRRASDVGHTVWLSRFEKLLCRTGRSCLFVNCFFTLRSKRVGNGLLLEECGHGLVKYNKAPI